MFHILLPRLFGFVIILEVVISVRKPEAAGAGRRNDLRRVMRILLGPERERRKNSFRVQANDGAL